jgi:hypothetical protein
MNPTQREKINRFLMDATMSDAVYEILSQSFQKKDSNDTLHLAASFISLHKLKEGWKELEKFKSDDGESESPKFVQVGM